MPTATPHQPERYCVVDSRYVLPFDEAFVLMDIISRAQRVEATYGDVPYRPVSSGDHLRCVMLPMSLYAVLQMERKD